MRTLQSLNAFFIGRARDGCYEHLNGPNEAQGLEFDCPIHGEHRIHVWFADPIGTYAPPPDMMPHPRWARQGETLDNLTLVPSIDYGACGHWIVVGGRVSGIE